jgi:hypothetical protein
MSKAALVFSNGDMLEAAGRSATEVVRDSARLRRFSDRQPSIFVWNRAALVKVYDLEPEGGRGGVH